MLIRLAWRNIWRNSRRTTIVLLSIVMGMLAIILDEGLETGMMDQMLENQIGANVGHVQIHDPAFRSTHVLTDTIANPALAKRVLDTSSVVAAYCSRVLAYGLASSTEESAGAVIMGVEPGPERRVSTIASSMSAGGWLREGAHGIVIGKALAEKLQVVVGRRVVLMATAADGSVASDMFRVTGVYASFSSEIEKTMVYVPIDDLRRMLGLGGAVSEIAVRARSAADADPLAAALRAQLGRTAAVDTYRDVLPVLVAQLDIYDRFLWIIYLIVGIAMVFGIVNAMLMSVFERIREFGVLLSLGMSTSRLFAMVELEALLLGMTGTAAGMGVGLAVHAWLSSTGINFAAFAEGMASFGISAVVYPKLGAAAVIRQCFIVPSVCVIAALYPAWKAVRLVPVRAITAV